MNFDSVREAAQLQFPDRRPTPAVVYSREFEGSRNSTHNAAAKTSTSNPSSFKGQQKGNPVKGKGKGKNAANPSRAYVTEAPDDAAPEAEDDDPQHEDQQDDAEAGEAAEERHLPMINSKKKTMALMPLRPLQKLLDVLQ